MSQCNSPQKMTFLNPSEWRIWLLSFQNFLRMGGGEPPRKPLCDPQSTHLDMLFSSGYSSFSFLGVHISGNSIMFIVVVILFQKLEYL